MCEKWAEITYKNKYNVGKRQKKKKKREKKERQLIKVTKTFFEGRDRTVVMVSITFI